MMCRVRCCDWCAPHLLQWRDLDEILSVVAPLIDVPTLEVDTSHYCFMNFGCSSSLPLWLSSSSSWHRMSDLNILLTQCHSD